MEKIDKKEYKNLTPFKGWVLENFPFIEADFDAITNYQLYSKIVEYLNNVIYNQNQVQGLSNELVDGYNSVVDYVNNYFDNLNVQDEINNKLDQMVESGQLQEIITDYLNSKAIFGFDTLADMKASTNLIDGSYARTLGKELYNDGKGQLYIIRNIKNTDVPDDNLLVALTNYPTLIAESIPNQTIDNIKNDITNINSSINTLEDDVDGIGTDINNIKNIINNSLSPIELLRGKNFVVFGDSYSEPEIANSEDELWVKTVAQATGMNRFNFAKAGAGFARTDNIMLSQVNTAIEQMTEEQKTNTKIAIVYGGFNDIINEMAISLIIENCSNLINAIHTNFPNAKIILAPFNWGFGGLTAIINHNIQYMITQMQKNLSNLPVIMLKYARYWNLGLRTWFRNAYHPGANGYYNIASYMIGAIYGSSEHVGLGGDIPLLHGNKKGCEYTYEDGKVSITFYANFGETLSNYHGTMNETLPPIVIPEHDIISPLCTANGSYIGTIRISTNGIMYIDINNSLPANSYIFSAPICYQACCNTSW